MANVTVLPGDPGSPEVCKLLEELDGYLTSLYPAESNHILSPASLRQPNVTFLVARVAGHVVGCGGFVDYGTYAEIKRMFVLPACRGLRIGRRLLDELEARARTAGLSVARLETGVSQPEAIRLYENAGYQRRKPFGNYGEDPLSIFMEKTLLP